MVGDEQTQRMGVFTYLLHRALTRNTAETSATWRRRSLPNSTRTAPAARCPRPSSTATSMRRCPGSNGLEATQLRQGHSGGWQADPPRGRVAGYDVGASLALYAPGAFDKRWPTPEVTEATAVTATAGDLQLVEGAEAIERGTLAAVVETPAISFRFVVSPPPASDVADDSAEGSGRHGPGGELQGRRKGRSASRWESPAIRTRRSASREGRPSLDRQARQAVGDDTRRLRRDAERKPCRGFGQACSESQDGRLESGARGEAHPGHLGV